VQAHYTHLVTGDYFAAAGIPLKEGRLLSPADSQGKGQVCLVDEDFARRYWHGSSALGHRLFNGPPEAPGVKVFTIVGVVGTIKQSDLADQRATGAVYYPYATDAAPLSQWVVVRTVQRPEAAGPAMRQAVLRIDPTLPLDDLKSMSDRIGDSLINRRTPMLLAGIFATVALVLAAVGIYGVLAYAVAQRQREIGVRMALGALPGQIRSQFLMLGGRLLAIGTTIGLVGAWAAGWAMSSLLYGTSSLNAPVLAVTATVLGAVVLLASFLPSRRAARVDPMVALRAE